ncbi:MAG: TetR/AcrR family transcriptional regulator [Verrucomicrobiota bacterium]
MPRPRDFDTEELLDQILLIFLENGWQQTSTRLLESSTGVKQVSLYHAFGNKEALFLAAFDHWAKQAATAQNQFLKGKGIDGIAKFGKAIVREDSPLPMPQCGCLAVNTALVAQEAGPTIQKRVQAYRDEMHQRILTELTREKKMHGLKPGLRLAGCADLVLNAIWGIFVTIRLSGTGPSVGKPAADALVATMRAWQAK